MKSIKVSFLYVGIGLAGAVLGGQTHADAATVLTDATWSGQLILSNGNNPGCNGCGVTPAIRTQPCE